MKRALLITPKSETVPHWKDTDYIGVDAGALKIIEEKLPLVFAVGDFDSMGEDDITYLKKKTKIYRHPVQKNETDSELAVRLAKEMGYEQLILWGAISGRMDHTLINCRLLLYRDPTLVLMDENQRISYLRKGTHILADDYKHISFFAMEESCLTLQGFLYPLEHRRVVPSDLYLSSNSFAEHEGIVFVESGSFLCVESNIQ